MFGVIQDFPGASESVNSDLKISVVSIFQMQLKRSSDNFPVFQGF